MKPNLTLFCTLFLAMLVGVSLQAQTPVSGNITSDTTWTAANSPFIVTADVIVAPGVTLNILPGVEVRFDPGTRLGVRGHLRAVGLDTAFVRFTSNGAVPAVGDWKGIVVSGRVSMRHVQGEFAEKFLNLYDGGTNTTRLHGSIFTHNDTAIVFDGSYSDSLVVWRCRIEHNRIGVLADSNTVIRYSLIRFNDWGVRGRGIAIRQTRFIENGWGALLFKSRVIRSYFEGNTEVALQGRELRVGYSRLYGNDIGILTPLTQFDLYRHNHLRANRVGLQIETVLTDSVQGHFQRNSICDSWFSNARMLAPAGVERDLTNNCWCDPDSAAVAATIVDNNDTTALGLIDFIPMDTTFCLPDRVYPGDANYNGVANLFDIFPIGIKYGSAGPIRPNASLQWVGQEAPDWGDTLFSGVDIKHTDCNGDGTINLLDIGAILLNYGETHNSNKTNTLDGIPMNLILPSGLQAGDTVSFPISFGSMSMPAQNVYGLGFSISYDTSLVVPGSFEVEFGNSWLGTPGVDLIGLFKELPILGQLDVAAVRTNQMPSSGFGQIADITVVLDEDIAKTASIPFSLEFVDSKAIELSQEEIPVATQDASTEVETTTGIEELVQAGIQLYPNPVQSELHLEFPQRNLLSLELLSPTGQLLQAQDLALQTQTLLPVSNLPAGVYLLRLQTREHWLTEKIMIVR